MKILADERMSVKSEALQTSSGPPEDFIKLEQEGEPTEELFIGKLHKSYDKLQLYVLLFIGVFLQI
jgi:hypothetical protein